LTVRISIIVAHDANNAIGKNGALPWNLPEDLQRFKAITMGKPVIMGRLTHESIGRALPGRQNIVITRQSGFQAEDCDVVTSPGDALRMAGDAEDVMVIGGGEIYALFLEKTERIYRTVVDADFDGDAFFPELPAEQWTVIDSEEYPGSEDRSWGYTVDVLHRRP